MKQMNIQVSPEDKRRYAEAATKEGRTLSNWIRWVLSRHVAASVDPKPPKAATKHALVG